MTGWRPMAVHLETERLTQAARMRLRVVVAVSAPRARTQFGQFGDLRFDDLDPPPHGQGVVAASGLEVQMKLVLAASGRT